MKDHTPLEVPEGAPPFEIKLQEIEENITYLAFRRRTLHPYMQYDDLCQEGRLKAWKLYPKYGHKPTNEWRRIFKFCFTRHVDSLYERAYKLRGLQGIIFVPLTEVEDWL